MQIVLEPERPEIDSVWNEIVPILHDHTTSTYHVYLTEPLESPTNYNKLCSLLDNAKAYETFIYYMNSPGGATDAGFQIIHSMVNTKAKVIGKVSGIVASMITLIALHCDELEVADYTQWLSHNYSAGVAQSKGFELKTYVTFSSLELEHAFREIHAGFLTEAEIQGVLEDRDIWLNAQQIRDKWKMFKPTTHTKPLSTKVA